jgi:hypothetical protein
MSAGFSLKINCKNQSKISLSKIMQNTKKLFLIMSARYFFLKWTIHKRRFILFSKEANGTYH